MHQCSQQAGDAIVLVLGTSVGGVGRHVRMLAAGLARRGHPIVVAGPVSTERQYNFTGGGASFTPLPISDRPRPLRDLHAICLLRSLRASRIVHAHGLRAGALTALALLGNRTPLVVTVHNAVTTGGGIAVISRLLERAVVCRADLVLAVSPDLEERMAGLGAVAVARAIVAAPPLRAPAETLGRIRADLEAGNRPIVLTVARLAPQKGLDAVLAVAAAHRRPEGPLFLIAGSGPLGAALQRRIEEERLPVRLLGTRDDVHDLLSVARTLLVPSLWEGQPLIVQEALRAGVPVVGTAVGGMPELVGDAGLLVPPGDPVALRRAVQTLLEDEKLVQRMAHAARRRELPGEEKAVAAALDAYASLCPRPSRRRVSRILHLTRPGPNRRAKKR